MRWIIRRYHSAAGDSQAFSDTVVNASVLSIGRGTDQDVLLDSLRVAYAHATLEHLGKDRFSLEVQALAGVVVDGSPARSADLQFDSEFEVGGFTLRIGKPSDANYLAIIEVFPPLPQQDVPTIREMSLAGSGLRRRRWAWVLALTVIGFGLLIPTMSRYDVLGGSILRSLPLLSHSIWNTGEISDGHKFFADDCSRCHTKLFQATPNEACLSCHDQVEHHSDNPAILEVAEFGQIRCIDCHRDHQGPDGIITQSPELCVDCHADPQAILAKSELAPVRDFEKHHPEFSPVVAWQDKTWVEASLADAPEDDSGLLFSHAVHLAKNGVMGPQGPETMVCADCHNSESARAAHFEPVKMQEDCRRCHALNFDPDDPGVELPHGDIAAAEQAIRAHYAKRAFEGRMSTSEPAAGDSRMRRRRPGLSAPAEPASQDPDVWAEEQAEKTIQEVFGFRLCAKCHVPQPTADGWTMSKVISPRIRMHSAHFNHHPHRTQACTDCHAVTESEVAADLNLPGIAVCRECHQNADANDGLPSTCIDCHDMHRAKGSFFATGGAMVPTKTSNEFEPVQKDAGEDQNAPVESAPAPASQTQPVGET